MWCQNHPRSVGYLFGDEPAVSDAFLKSFHSWLLVHVPWIEAKVRIMPPVTLIFGYLFGNEPAVSWACCWGFLIHLLLCTVCIPTPLTTAVEWKSPPSIATIYFWYTFFLALGQFWVTNKRQNIIHWINQSIIVLLEVKDRWIYFYITTHYCPI